jgi:glutamyl/glutaminyl-tRNA synthetase
VSRAIPDAAGAPLAATLPSGATTRFAPAPTGRLHLGHLANAIFVWGLARRTGGRVILRIEDHDRQRCRPEFEAALLDDLDRLSIRADEPPTDALRAGPSRFRQSDNDAAYARAVVGLRERALVYACDCGRSTFDRWQREQGALFTGPGCPGACRERRLADRPGLTLRVALGDGTESWFDRLRGPSGGAVTPAGDLPVRDRNGNWTYALCVVVDDLRHGIDLVVRGEDLVDATASQIRLGALLGRAEPPIFAHHPLVRRPDGSKLSKADGDTALGELMDAGQLPDDLLGQAAWQVGLTSAARRLSLEDAIRLLP